MPIVIDAGRRQRFVMLCGVFLCLLFAWSAVPAANLLPGAPILISEAGSTRAMIDPRASRNGDVQVLRPGAGTLVTLYVANLDLLPGEGRTAFRSDIEDARGVRYPLEIVSFERSSEVKGTHALTVRLHPDIGDVGDVLIRVTWRGMSSNRVRLSIGHQDSRIKDDEGSG